MSVYLEHLSEKTFLEDYQKKCFLIGKEVIVLPGNKKAMVLGIDENVGLMVEFSDGTQTTLRTGEVSVMVEK